MEKFQIIKDLCRNGGFCPLDIIESALACTRKELIELLDDAPFSFRIGKYLNQKPLLIINK